MNENAQPRSMSIPLENFNQIADEQGATTKVVGGSYPPLTPTEQGETFALRYSHEAKLPEFDLLVFDVLDPRTMKSKKPVSYGMHSLIKSATLKDVQWEPGKIYALTYYGLGKAKSGFSAPKLFVAKLIS